jgi:hypothetical protein
MLVSNVPPVFRMPNPELDLDFCVYEFSSVLYMINLCMLQG